MLDKSLFQIDIVGNTATISYTNISSRATCITLADRSPAVVGYVSHQIVESVGEPRFELVVAGDDINNIVDQAFVSLA